MAYTKFFPTSNDLFLKAGSDMALAKFGHLNSLIDYVNTAVDYNSTTGMTTIRGQEVVIVSGSGATVTLATSQSGSTILMDRAAGITFTLPVATSATVGMYFDFVVTTTGTGTYKVVTGASTEYLIGAYTGSGGSNGVFQTGTATNRAITMDADTKGRLVGTKLRFTCVSTTAWMVEGIAVCSGISATAFAIS